MRLLYAVMLAFSVLMLGAGAASARELPKPQLLAVYFYADWCPNCKLLSPIVTQARSEGALDEKAILFVTLNLTDKASIHQSILQAQALGIGDYLKAQGSATGYVALLDATTKTERTRFDRTTTSAAIVTEINTQLAAKN